MASKKVKLKKAFQELVVLDFKKQTEQYMVSNGYWKKSTKLESVTDDYLTQMILKSGRK